mgnify:CR=1 FL=1
MPEGIPTPDADEDLPPDGATETRAEDSAAEGDAGERLVPAWLAVLVLVLLLAVAAVGGFLLRGLLIDDAPPTSAQITAEEWSEQVEQDPNDPVALLNLAYAQQQEGDLEGALEGYDRVDRKSVV